MQDTIETNLTMQEGRAVLYGIELLATTAATAAIKLRRLFGEHFEQAQPAPTAEPATPAPRRRGRPARTEVTQDEPQQIAEAPAKPISNYWSRMTPQQRKKEMARRLAKRQRAAAAA